MNPESEFWRELVAAYPALAGSAPPDQGGARPPLPPDVESGGGPSHDPRMEARVAVLEQIAKNTEGVLKEMREDVRELRRAQERDFRLSIVATIATAIGLAGMIAKGFKWF